MRIGVAGLLAQIDVAENALAQALERAAFEDDAAPKPMHRLAPGGVVEVPGRERGGRLLYVPVVVSHMRRYTWGSLVRQSWQRGRGEAHFRLKHEGRRGWLGPVRRIAAAKLRLLVSPFRGDPALRAAAALANLATAAGAFFYRPARSRSNRWIPG